METTFESLVLPYLEDFREISHVVGVMALCRGRSQVGKDGVVHGHRRLHDRLDESLAFRRKSFQKVSENGPENERHAVVLQSCVSVFHLRRGT